MFKYVLRRLIQSIPIFLGITLLSYLLMAATPGGPAAAMSFGMRARDAERLRVQLGVDDPWPLQYVRWLLGDDWMRWDSDGDGVADGSFIIPLYGPDGEPLPPGTRLGAIRGDFGTSFALRRPVMDIIVERFPATIELSVAALIVSVIVGITIGILAAVYHDQWFDHVTRVLAVIFDAVPIFFLGLMLLLIFGSSLGWLPLGGRCAATLDASCPPIFQRLNYLLLPTFVLATGGIAAYSRYMRASMLDVVSTDYIRTARSKGLNDRQIWFRHGARNALIPIATFLGPAIAFLIGGAVVTETIFSWPGVGRTAVAAVTQRDYPLVMATVIFSGLSTIVGYLLSDIMYAVIDPRIRFS
jgi:peptide/nickel transport system permease protein